MMIQQSGNREPVLKELEVKAEIIPYSAVLVLVKDISTIRFVLGYILNLHFTLHNNHQVCTWVYTQSSIHFT